MPRASSSTLDTWTPNSEDSKTPTKRTTKVYLIPVKLSPCQISEYHDLIESSTHFTLCSSPKEADVIVTAVSMKQRLMRHVPSDIARVKPIVKPEWLVRSIQGDDILPYEDYLALPLLRDESPAKSQPMTPDPATPIRLTPMSPVSPPPKINLATPSSSSPLRPSPRPGVTVQASATAKLDYTSNYCCCRASPLKCPNEELVQQFSVIRRMRELEEGQEMRALAYERTIAVLKAFPEVVSDKNLDKVEALPYVGQKSMTKNFYELVIYPNHVEFPITFLHPWHRTYTQLDTISMDVRYRTLVIFNKIYGVGPSNARKYYDTLGLRTLEDIALYHGVHLEEEQRLLHEPLQGLPTGEPPNLGIGRAIALVPELDEKIPRKEVEQIRDVVMEEFAAIQPGCINTIAGGYRRGKEMSNDVDIIISHPERGKVTNLCKTLVRRLHEKGYVKNVMHMSSFHAPHALRTSNWDSLEKSLTVFILPGKRYHRRVDLIFAEPEVYWAAVVGWSGSKMFERDLRKWAKDKKGLKFDSSGITRRFDSKFIPVWSEQEVFDVLGLAYVPPELRNADA